jgi:hypothetical protein
LSDGSLNEKIPPTPVYLDLLQSEFHYPSMSPYSLTYATLVEVIKSPSMNENAISASSKQLTFGAGSAQTLTVEDDRVIGGTYKLLRIPGLV